MGFTPGWVKIKWMPHDKMTVYEQANHHRLNGSSSHVLTTTSLSYGKTKNSTPHKIKTPNPIKMKKWQG